jgi:environmental stress-induced protein Ves
MKILRARDYRRMPWKNGKGETIEVAVYPENAGLDDFEWRISMASVTTDGPFSSFPGIDRTLSVLTGEGIELSVAGQPPVTLTQSSAPYSFPADQPTTARLINGPITDLNVMTRRGVKSHEVTRRVLERGERIDVPKEGVTLILAKSAVLLKNDQDEKIELGELDCLLQERVGGSWIPTSGAENGVFLIHVK